MSFMGSLFDEMLKENESLFINQLALSYEFVPKLVPYREAQQKRIAACIAPLFHDRTGRNIAVHGIPGVGKTVATLHVKNELEEKTDKILPIYINCWQKNTSYKVVLGLCQAIDYNFTHNKKTDELFDIVANRLNKFATVFIFDEIDKADDLDFLYLILQKVHNKAIILLTNYKDVIAEMDMRIRSRLLPEVMEFLPYSAEEIRGILRQRIDLAFVPKVWQTAAFEKVVEKTAQLKDIRSGLYLLKESGLLAEEKSQKIITLDQVNEAIGKLEEFKVKSTEELADETKSILNLIKQHSPIKIGDLYKLYDEMYKGNMSYKTFTRKIARLTDGKFITLTKTEGGVQGNTSIITYSSQVKTLDDFSP